jgi:hypothetical protein
LRSKANYASLDEQVLNMIPQWIKSVFRKAPQASDRKEYPSVPEAALKGVVRTVYDSPTPTEAQQARKSRSIAMVKALGLPHTERLPVVEDETDIQHRSGQEVAKRCIAVALCAVKGETNDQKLIDQLVETYSAGAYFSPAEIEFIRAPSPERQKLIDFCWMYECAHVFLWALGHINALNAPNVICEVAKEVGLIRDAGAAFVNEAKLRPLAELLDMVDLYYRLHWAAIDLRLKGNKSKEIDEGIIRERHRALNWLTRYMNQDWDDVATDT